MTVADAEAQCREFAIQFPTPNVQKAIELAEAGRVSWFKIYDLFRVAAAEGVKAVEEVHFTSDSRTTWCSFNTETASQMTPLSSQATCVDCATMTGRYL